MVPAHIEIVVAKSGQSVFATGQGNVTLHTRNLAGEMTKLVLLNCLFVPKLTRTLVSVSSLKEDQYQTVFPCDGSVIPGGILDCRRGRSKSPIPIVQVGGLFFLQTFPQVRVPEPIHPYLWWHRILGHIPFHTLHKMIRTMLGLDQLKGCSVPAFTCPECRKAKMTRSDTPSSVDHKATRP